MTKKIFHSILISSFVVLAAAFVLIFGFLYAYTNSVFQRQLKAELGLAAKGVEALGIEYLETLDVGDYRATWIANDGTVLFESGVEDVSSMENHAEREEVRQALLGGYGESRRYSSTMLEQFIYAAKRLSDNTVLRLSLSRFTAIRLLLGMLQPIAVIIALTMFMSAILAMSLSKRVVQPLNNIDLDNPLENDDYDELSPFLNRINTQQLAIRSQEREIRRRQHEFDTILDSMNEGMLLLDNMGIIISINNSAKRLLGINENCTGRDIITVNRNAELLETVSSALEGSKLQKNIELADGSYQVNASPIVNEGELKGAAIVLFDITEREQAEKFRREFSANVSHELKTPLHAISGYAELIKNGMAKQEDIPSFAGRVYNEAQRTIKLVEDIISLSHLDEGAQSMDRETMDVLGLAIECANQLKPLAEENSVSITVNGSGGMLYGIPALIETVLYNLCENAIKYNTKNGSVNISVEGDTKELVLTVSDTGIGIPPEDRKRIFERFYRVDKSHSRNVGGTGLGLSIVKHAVSIHNGRIELISESGKGSSFIVTFPKQALDTTGIF